MIVKAILLGLVSSLGVLDGRWLGITMLDRPLVMCTLVGIILGDVQQGILIGATLEAIFLGNITIGAAAPPDIVVGSVLATAFAISSGKGTEAALTLAMPIAILAQTIGILVRVANAQFMHKALDYAKIGNAKMVELMHLLPAGMFVLSVFIPTFLAYAFGADIVSAILDAIPTVIINGLTIASNILPAFGFALLINMMISKKLIPYFFLGFLIVAYSGIDIIGVALFGVILATIISQLMPGNNSSQELDDDLEVL